MTIPGIYAVERFGRRKCASLTSHRPLTFSDLMAGALWMSLMQMAIAIAYTAAPDADASKKVLVAFTCLFIAGFASTWGPGAWVLIAEVRRTRCSLF